MSALRHALRSLRRSPGLFGLVVVTLALGIGGTTAVFTVVDGLLLRPLPYADADRLLELWTERTRDALRTPGLDAEILRAFRADRRPFAAVEGYQMDAVTLTGSGEPVIVAAPRVTPGMLPLLGAAPRLGRLFDEADAVPGSRAVLVSSGLWQRRFGGARDILGQTLRLDDEPHTIVGVLPEGFGFPERNAEVWRPVALDGPGRVHTVVQLPPDGAGAALSQPLATLSAQLQEAGLLSREHHLVLEELLQKRYGQRFATALYAMLGAVALVLLVACVNVTHLLLARSVSRRGEMALELALGAGRSRLAARVLVESLGMAVLGGLGGVLLARFLLATILDLVPPHMTMLSTLAALDGRALAFALALTAGTCLLVGTLPALWAARTDPIAGLRGRAPGSVDRGAQRGQSALIAAQLALVFVLLAGAGLLLHSFVRLVSVDPGFDPENLHVITTDLPAERYAAPGAKRQLLEELEALVEADPAVRAASFVVGAPPHFSFTRLDRPETESGAHTELTGLMLPFSEVAPDYFATMGISLMEGRTFARSDPERVAIVNDRFAHRLWGAASPIGRRFRLVPEHAWRTVIGVARDVRAMGPSDPMGDGMEIYFPFPSSFSAGSPTFLVRSHRSDPGLVQRVRERLWSLDDRLPVWEATTMKARLLESVARPRFFLRLSVTFAAVAALLAGIGVYGTAAFWVARRRHELGVRMAIGATRRAILALLVGRALRVAAWGCALGAAVSVASARVLGSLLFETSPQSPAVLAGVMALLGGLVLAATYLPARSASRLDPASVLRSE
jgi:predicted permease